MARLILLGKACDAQNGLIKWLEIDSKNTLENGVEFMLKRSPSAQDKQEIRKILSPIKGDFALLDDDFHFSVSFLFDEKRDRHTTSTVAIQKSRH